ncbi:MAG: M23 family metallopeptidase [Balneolaceae bacterium]|nr:M23 family metallopeptidase [Balneolaceae bacterium]
MIFLILLLTLGFDTTQHKEVEVFKREINGVIEIWAMNPNIYPVTVELSATLTNLNSDKPLPHIEVLTYDREEKLFTLVPVDPAKAWNFETNYITYTGDVYARHDDSFQYRFPFRNGSTFGVSQGFGGEFSHQGNIQYSIDFMMPEGTPIYAARDGMVIEVKEDSQSGGDDKKYVDEANTITILHGDGTMADYSHLQFNGAHVRVGQSIKLGQFIGYSGSTGFVTGPHLHFGVKKTLQGGKYETIPIKFATPNGPVVPQEGKRYRAY